MEQQTQPATMAWCRLGNIAVGVHNPGQPSDQEWEGWLGMCREMIEQGQLQGCLVWTAGGAPNSKQRAMVKSVPGLLPVPIAIMTDSRVARGVITALSWLGKAIKPFPANDLQGALEYLGSQQAAAEVQAEIDALRSRVM